MPIFLNILCLPLSCYVNIRKIHKRRWTLKVVAVTACPTGIAHTYMAAGALVKAASKHNVQIKVETQGAMGTKNPLTSRDITQADKVLIVSDIDVDQSCRFESISPIRISIEEVLLNVDKVYLVHCRR